MKRMIALLLAICLLCPPLSACGREEPLEPWQMPTVDSKPTPVPTAAPSFGGGSPEHYIWNEAALLLMNNPGAAPGSAQKNYTHKQCADESGRASNSHRINILSTHARFRQRTISELRDDLHVGAGGNLRHNAAINRVQRRLRKNLVRQDLPSVAHECNCGFVTGGLHC